MLEIPLVKVKGTLTLEDTPLNSIPPSIMEVVTEDPMVSVFSSPLVILYPNVRLVEISSLLERIKVQYPYMTNVPALKITMLLVLSLKL